MCDYSLETYASESVVAGETYTLQVFPSGSKGFAKSYRGAIVACCVKEGQVLDLIGEMETTAMVLRLKDYTHYDMSIEFRQAFYRFQVMPDTPHDALLFPSGRLVFIQALGRGCAMRLHQPAQRQIDLDKVLALPARELALTD